MRLALFSDVHGNLIALDAVLADIHAQGGVDETWVLGDLVAIGPEPIRTLERLRSLPNTRFVRGNTDRYVVTGELPKPTLANVEQDLTLLPRLLEMARNFAWTQGALACNNAIEWLAQLPVEQRTTLPDGTRLLGVHASAGKDDGRGAYPGIDDTELQALMQNADADLVCVGHTHAPLDLTTNGLRVVNLGSVSNSVQDDLRASYVIIQADQNGYSVEHRRVEYDREAVIAMVERMRHPAGQFIIQYMRGKNIPHWSKPK